MGPDHLEVLYQHPRQLSGRQRQDVRGRVLGIAQASGRDQHQARQPLAVLDCQPRGQVAAERKPDQMHPAQSQSFEQLEIVQHVVMQIGHCRIIG